MYSASHRTPSLYHCCECDALYSYFITPYHCTCNDTLTASEAAKATAERSAQGEDDEDHDNRKLKKVRQNRSITRE